MTEIAQQRLTPFEAAGRTARAYAEARQRLFAETSRGARIPAGLSEAADRAVANLLPLAEGPIALCAVGGYGRGRLAPNSDVDLLVLTPKGEGARAEPVLYALFDSDLAVSQSVHDPASAVSAAEDDVVCRTAFLDARFLAGEAGLFADFQKRFDRLRERTAAAFVRAKLEERDERHARQGASRYAIEPDVKEGKGGLRDLDLLHWLDRYTHGITEVPSLRTETPGLFTEQEVLRLRRTQDFLWSVRTHLHDLRGRADERLGFDVQPALAERLGYRARRGTMAEERLMKHYFLNATEVGRLTGLACAALEERALKNDTRRRFSLFTEKLAEEAAFDGAANLVRRGQRLTFADHNGATIEDLFALFLASGRSGLALHPDTLKTATRLARKVRRVHRTDPALARTFLEILRQTENLERILRRMNECGLLGRYLPTFGRVVGRTEYGLFRRFTLDEHVLRAVGSFAMIRSGKGVDEFPLTTPIAAAPDPALVTLALLLQESEAGLPPGRLDRADRTVRAQCLRLFAEAEADEIAFLVRERDLLARTAQRRAITDLRAVEAVAEIAGTRERLDLLSLVTACRHHTVGVGSWKAYKDRDARLLVEQARAYLAGGTLAFEAFQADRENEMRRQTALISELDGPQLDAFFARAGEELWSMASPEAVADLAAIVTRADAQAEAVAVSVSQQADGTGRLAVYAPDRLGQFGDVAGVIAEAGLTVWGASAFSLAAPGDGPPRAVTLMEAMRPGTPPEALDFAVGEAERIEARLREVIRGEGAPLTLPPFRLTDRRAAFDVPAEVRTYQDASPDALIVEAEGLDQPGLLHLLAEEVEDAGVSILRAYVATYGEKAVDSFYLQHPDGRKVEDVTLIERLRERLLGVLAT